MDGLSTFYIFPVELTPNTTYYWRVKCLNDIGDASNWSVLRSFRTRLNTPALIAPAEGANPHTLTPTFEWTPSAGAASYTLQIATNTAYTYKHGEIYGKRRFYLHRSCKISCQ